MQLIPTGNAFGTAFFFLNNKESCNEQLLIPQHTTTIHTELLHIGKN